MGWWKRIAGRSALAAGLLGAAAPSEALSPLARNLERHVRAIASVEHNTAHPAALEASARYIEATLAGFGLQVHRQEFRAGSHAVRNLEVILGGAGDAARRVYIVGAHYDSAPGAPGANDNGSGSAALLELARRFKDMVLPAGAELRLVFYVNEEPPWFLGPDMGSMRHAQRMREQLQAVKGVWILETIGHYSTQRNSQRYPPGLEQRFPDTGDFLAIVSTTQATALVERTLAAFKAASDFPAQGLAAPASTGGVTLSDHTPYLRHGFPALMLTDTAFMRYPHYHTAQDTPDKVDYASVARIVEGLTKALPRLMAE